VLGEHGDDNRIPPLALVWGGLRAVLDFQAAALETIVDVAGQIHAATRTTTRAEAAHDFCLFCVTKVARSVRALTLLQDATHSEECYPISRSLYEHYLAMAAVQGDISFLDDFLIKPLGLRMGTLRHGMSKSGRLNYREIVHPETGLKLAGIRPSSAWARATGWPADAALHGLAYGFLSDHVHPNMIAADDMRNENADRFIYDGSRGLLQAAFWCCLTGHLTIQAAGALPRARAAANGALVEAEQAGEEALSDALELLQPAPHYEEMPGLIRARLDDERQIGDELWRDV